MAAPLLVLRALRNGQEGALMTLSEFDLENSFWADASNKTPAGLSSSVQILADGQFNGLLLPGESVEIPVYWAGWQQTSETTGSIEFSVKAMAADDTTPLNFNELKSALKPTSCSSEAWEVVWNRFRPLLGNTNTFSVKWTQSQLTVLDTAWADYGLNGLEEELYLTV